MKTLLIIILATVLSGCANMASPEFAKNFAAGLQGATQSGQTQSQSYSDFSTNVTGIKTVDNQCMAQCAKQGYQYGLCVKSCSY